MYKRQAWRGTSRLLTRPTAAGITAAGQPVSTTGYVFNLPSTATGSTADQLPQQRGTEMETVVPLQFGVAGPQPLQRSIANVVSARRLPNDFTVRRPQTGYAATRPLSSSFVNVENTPITSDTSNVTRQLNAVAQVAHSPL